MSVKSAARSSLKTPSVYTSALAGNEGPLTGYQFILIGGGGGGGTSRELYGSLNTGGGGGAGGYLSSITGEFSGGNTSPLPTFSVPTGVNFSVIIGAGGTGGATTRGTRSLFGSNIAYGGGAGHQAIPASQESVGASGGGTYSAASEFNVFTVVNGLVGQGSNGGWGNGITTSFQSSGAGGGAGGTGGGPTNGGYWAGIGGVGITSSVTGTPVGRAGGGGGAAPATYGGGTAVDGGGAGGIGAVGTAGTANTGGGGGAGGTSGTTSAATKYAGGNGGSGVLILKYPSQFTITIGAGLTGTTTTVGLNKVTTITAGTGNVSWT